MRRTTSTVMAGVALAFFACSPSGFNTPTLLNKVRVLAIQADPPQPALGESTTLRALVYQPPPSADGADAAVSVTGYSWSWCPLPMSPTDPGQCPIDQDAATQLFAGIPGVPLLDLGQGETATFTNPFPASMLASLCEKKLDAIPALAAAAASKGGLTANGSLNFGCAIAGFPITVKLVVHTSAGYLPAVFPVYLSVNDNIAANLNPVVGAISVTVDKLDHQLDQAGTQWILRNSAVPVSIDVPPTTSEAVPALNDVLPSPPDPKEDPYLRSYGSTSERLNLYWFAECGDFGGNGVGGRSTLYLPGDPINTFLLAQQNTWNIPKLEGYLADFARIIVVVSDNRGGVAWTSGVAHLLDSPPDAGASDSPEADGGEPMPDAGAVDSEAADSADAVQESMP